MCTVAPARWSAAMKRRTSSRKGSLSAESRLSAGKRATHRAPLGSQPGGLPVRGVGCGFGLGLGFGCGCGLDPDVDDVGVTVGPPAGKVGALVRPATGVCPPEPDV